MKAEITPEQLVKYLYNETDELEKLLIKTELKRNFFLFEEYIQMKEAKSLLSSFSFSPSDKTVEKILNHSLHAVTSPERV